MFIAINSGVGCKYRNLNAISIAYAKALAYQKLNIYSPTPAHFVMIAKNKPSCQDEKNYFKALETFARENGVRLQHVETTSLFVKIVRILSPKPAATTFDDYPAHESGELAE